MGSAPGRSGARIVRPDRTSRLRVTWLAGTAAGAQLTRVHAALTSLPEADQARLAITAGWKAGPH
jgi:hypothetical protein